MLKRTFAIPAVYLLLLIIPVCSLAQPTWTFDPFGKEKKPEQYQDKKLGSEKTADKKFTVPRNFIQNTVTHFNYFFNANNRVNAVIERAKMANKDEYASLLSFYPYSLDNTKTQTTELDSVVITSTAGILLHDLRNDWIDNMYLLIGKAYFLRKDFDSAAMTFQFINYNLFPRKRKNDDDDRIIGTTSAAANSAISIANKEKRNILQKIASRPPSRNDALIWLARTFIEQEEYGDAAGLINTLQNDPNLPKRLRNDLEEVNAYWFFRQGIYDSAAVHLEKALTAADTKQDKSRWEYLLGQMYEMNGQFDKASKYYSKASKHTVDPLLDIYAQLNEAKMMKGGSVKELEKSINNLTRMGRKDKFDAYRDIVYYAAGQLALQKPDTGIAIGLYKKSLKYNEGNISYKNRTFLQLGDIAYNRKQYRLAAAMYDSVQANDTDTALALRIKRMQERKAGLTRIVEATENIEREDSLQRIAGMEAGARDEFIKRLLKKMRKEKGIKDNGGTYSGDMQPFGSNTQPADLFGGNNNKGEWYFYNNSLKSRGFGEFKSKWGDRANVDNWRRRAVASNVQQPAASPGRGDTRLNPGDLKNATTTTAGGSDELTYDAMIQNVPLTEEKMNASNEILATSLLTLARAYQEDLEEYQMAADTYEDYLRRFPARLANGEVYLGLYFCYTKLGNTAKADYYKGLLNSKFAGSPSAQKLSNPGMNDPKVKNPAATKLYENIYTLFIEGHTEQAMAEKKKADSLYGINYWTPQLVYIEALQHVKNRNDSLAISTLQTLMTTYPNSPLSEKAATMIDVVKRRSEIEKYLTELQVTRAPDDPTIVVPNDPPPVVKAPVTKQPADTIKKVTPPPPPPAGSFAIDPAAPHYVMMVLDKVDGVYVNEAKNAFNRYNRENYYGQTIDIVKDAIDGERSILLISPFANADAALVYYDKIRKSAAREVSWLPANKYSFIIISNDNLQLLKGNKNLQGYKTLLNNQYPNRF